MSEPIKKGSNGTVEQIIEHMTADIQNADGQYIQLGFTPPPTPNDVHIWSHNQNQLPQNPFLQYNIRNAEAMNYIDPNARFINQNVPYNNFVPQNSIYVPELQNKFVLYQGATPQYVMTNQDIPMCNFMPIYPESRENLYANPDLSNSSNNNIHQTLQEPLKTNVMIQPTPNRNHLIDNLVENWTSNTNGTYSPFGNMQNQNSSNFFNIKQTSENQISDKERNDINIKTMKTTVKKHKQIAEVKPMRPSYSDVLTKSIPLQIPKPEKVENGNKNQIGKKNSKNNKFMKVNLKRQSLINDKENSLKSSEKSLINQKVNLSRKWVSLDDVSDHSKNEFIKVNLEPTNNVIKSNKKTKKSDNTQNLNSKTDVNSSNKNNSKKFFHDNSTLGCQWNDSEENNENLKNDEKNVNKNPNKKVKDSRSNSAKQNKFNEKSTDKLSSTIKRSQRNRKKDNHFSLGFIRKNFHHYVSRWFKIIFTCLLWFLNLISDIFSMSIHLGKDLGTVLWDSIKVYSKIIYQNISTIIRRIKFFTKIGAFIDQVFGNYRWAFWKKKSDDKYSTNSSLEHNINMPTTGEEAMKRLLACKGKDPYSILGVRSDCTDDDIKRYYKRQAFLVHPDKNPQPGAEEAFKILVHAFDIIGEPERRQSYDRKVTESHQVEQAWTELSDLLSQLHKKMEYAANTIRCTNCTQRHRRIAVDRPCYAARLCSQCKIHHSAKEGDIWAETTCLGFLWHYYACMDGGVYDITEWAGCQRKNLKHLKPNSHNVQYRIVLGKQMSQGENASGNGYSSRRHKSGATNNSASEREADLENFLNNLYNHQSDKSTSRSTNTSTNTEFSNTNAKNRKKNKRKK